MTVYNDLRFLDEAVDSILQQDFRDLELVIVDDGTRQHARFKTLERRDPRIRLVVNPTNLGAATAANRGIEASRADIIVRLDADDVAEPTRVGRLVAAFAADSQLGLIGSAVALIDQNGQSHGVQRMPETDLEIRWTILFHNPFYHSAAAFRRSCFKAAGRYRIDELVSQDHYLWFDMLPLCRAQNLAEPLTRYRMNSRGLTAANAHNARNRTNSIRETEWRHLGLTYDLYDDAFADDITAFVRGDEIAAERRAPAYRKLLTVLRAFLAVPQPLARAEDAASARQLARGVISRILACPPPDPRDRAMIAGLCWPLDRRAVINTKMASFAGRFKAGVQIARDRLIRSRPN